MKLIKNQMIRVRKLASETEGLTTVEYAILLAVVALVAIIAWGALGTAVSKKAQEGADAINNVPPAG